MFRIINLSGMKDQQWDVLAAMPGFRYAGKDFAGWPNEGFGNPWCWKTHGRLGAVKLFRQTLLAEVRKFLATGEKSPLVEAILSLRGYETFGCWCTNSLDAENPKEVEVCHCQAIAKCWRWLQAELAKRQAPPAEPPPATPPAAPPATPPAAPTPAAPPAATPAAPPAAPAQAPAVPTPTTVTRRPSTRKAAAKPVTPPPAPPPTEEEEEDWRTPPPF